MPHPVGPQFPEDVFVYYAAPVTLNSTHVAIVGANADYSDDLSDEGLGYLEGYKSIENYYKTIVYNFETNTWNYWARLPLSEMYSEMYDYYHRSPISAVIFFDKIGNR